MAMDNDMGRADAYDDDGGGSGTWGGGDESDRSTQSNSDSSLTGSGSGSMWHSGAGCGGDTDAKCERGELAADMDMAADSENTSVLLWLARLARLDMLDMLLAMLASSAANDGCSHDVAMVASAATDDHSDARLGSMDMADRSLGIRLKKSAGLAAMAVMASMDTDDEDDTSGAGSAAGSDAARGGCDDECIGEQDHGRIGQVQVQRRVQGSTRRG
ncbi:hypothetical protein BC831DRAFT_435749 [Entophlyctis helioformis]|nr:hypothetical protein BC831DRAFT_435749 [Entophlyctis helioformis]